MTRAPPFACMPLLLRVSVQAVKRERVTANRPGVGGVDAKRHGGAGRDRLVGRGVYREREWAGGHGVHVPAPTEEPLPDDAAPADPRARTWARLARELDHL